MVLFEDHYYELTYRFSRMVGIWPYQSSKDKIIRKFVTLLFVLSAVAAHITSIFTSGYQLEIIVECIAVDTTALILLMKYCTYMIYNNEIYELMEFMREDWHSIDTKGELEVIRQSAEEGRQYIQKTAMLILSLAIFVIGMSSTWMYILDILLPLNETRSYELPVTLEYFVDVQRYFLLIIVHVDVSLFCGVLIVIATDAMYMMFVYHACGLFRICSYKLEHTNYMDGTIRSFCGHDKLRKKIGNCVAAHRRAIKYAHTITGTYTWSFFSQLVLAIGTTSILLYYLTVYANRLNDIIMYSIFVFGQMAQIFIVTHPGQKLVDHSGMILSSAYNAQWYTIPPNAQKLFILIMRRGLTPSIVSMGKIFVSSVEQYLTVMQTSVSYFMVLRSLT